VLIRYHGWGGLSQVFKYHHSDESWRKRAEALREALTSDEYDEARSSTVNANYTDPAVVQAMWAALERMGFKGGKVLDPSAGIGYFYALMPEELERGSKLMAIDKDSLSARLAAQVLQRTAVKHAGFEEVRLPERYFDLVVSNVPFADVSPVDKKYNPDKRFLHDYFFLKSLELVRPGGIVAFITARGTMDKIAKGGPEVRKTLAAKADLIGAVRMPENAFKDVGLTTVTTDIIFLRRKAGERSDLTETWLESQPMELEVPDGAGQWWSGYDAESGADTSRNANINEYYHRHPEQMATRMIWRHGRYGNSYEPAMAPSDQPIGEVVVPLLERLPANVMVEEGQAAFADEAMYAIQANVDDVKDGGFAEHEGKLWVKRESLLHPHEVKPDVAARIRAYLQVMKARRAALNGELKQLDDAELKPLREALRQRYDAYVKAHGPLNAKQNKRAWIDDPDAPAVLALEHWDAEAQKVTGLADIFRERVVAIRTAPTHADNALDALAAALNYRGKVDWGYMQGLTGQRFEETREALRGMVYNDPMAGWVTADAYLSGHVREKLEIARVAAETDDAYGENVQALEAVQPADLTPQEIHANLGANWIPVETVRDFLAHLLDLSPRYARNLIVSYAKPTGQWFVQIGGENQADARRNADAIKQSTASRTTWGTREVGLLALMEFGLNGGVPKVTDEVSYITPEGNQSTRQVVNEQETEAARAKLALLREEFQRWAWDDPQRSETLTRLYNEQRNAVVLRRYQHPYYAAGKPELAFPGQSPNDPLRGYQAAFVWRVLQDLDAYAGHEVGTGKTFSMITAAMELKRTGLKKKPLFAVMNSTVSQFRAEFLRLYPNANILTVHIGANNRQRRLALGRIANNNWDAVIVTHESFNRIPVSPATEMRRVRQELEDLEAALLAAQAVDTTGGSWSRRGKAPKSITVKALEKAKLRLEGKMKALGEIREKDQGVTFEDLGVDQLFIDEAQVYKNLAFYTKLQGQVKGLGDPKGSGAAWGLFMKARYIQETFGGGVVLASGTPISNSVAEVYTLQRYLDYDKLREAGLHHFDRWAAEYGDVGVSSEYAPEGGGFREVVRFRRFYNAPEMLQAVYRRLDVLTAEEAGIPRPAMEQGKPYQIVVPQTPSLALYQEELIQRAKDVRRNPRRAEHNGKPDNMLVVVSDGLKAAMDMRLIDPSYPDEPDSKTNKAVEVIYQEYQRTTGMEVPNPRGEGTIKVDGVSLVFSDRGVPNTGEFSVYEEIKRKLVARGVPAHEIAFAQEVSGSSEANKAARLAQHARVRAGKIRVFIGSTKTMGTGVNVQDRVSMLLHLDVWWNLSNWLQRNGRGIRFGNLFPEVRVLNIGAERTVDTFVWDKVQQKGVIVDKIMSKNLTERVMEDVSRDTASAGEAMAHFSGNPLIKRESDLKQEVRRMLALRQAHVEAQRGVWQRLRQAETDLPRLLGEVPLAGEYHSKLEELAEDGALLIFEPKRATATALSFQEDAQNNRAWKIARGVIDSYLAAVNDNNAKIRAARDAFEDAFRAANKKPPTSRDYPPEAQFTRLKPVQVGVFASGGMTLTWTIKESESYQFATINSVLSGKRGKYEFAHDTTPRTLIQSTLKYVGEQNANRVAEIRRLRKELPKLREESNRPFALEEELRAQSAELEEVSRALRVQTEDTAVVAEGPVAGDDGTSAPYVADEDADADMEEGPDEDADLDEDADDGVRFDLEARPAVAERLSARLIDAKIRGWLKGWTGLAGFQVRVVERERDLPVRALRALERRRKQSPRAFARAVFLPGEARGDGELVFVAEGFGSLRQVLKTLMHEAGLHVGLRRMMGPQLDALLEQVADAHAGGVARIAQRYGYDLERTNDRLAAAEEYLAHLAESHEDMGLLRQVYALVRRWLREMGVNLRLSDADIDYILSAARRTAREGLGGEAAGMRRAYGGRAKGQGSRAVERFAMGDRATGDARALARAVEQGWAPVEGGVRFALAEEGDEGGSPVGGGHKLGQELAAVVEGLGEWAGDKWRGALPATLGAVTLRQLADLGAKHLPAGDESPGIVGYLAAQQRMDVRRNAMVEESGVFAGDVWERWARKPENRKEAQELGVFIHDTTREQVDPSGYRPLQVALQLGPGELFWRTREANEENVRELVRQARDMARSGKREDRGLAGYYVAAAKKLKVAAAAEQKRRQALPELERRWLAFSPEARAIYTQARDLYGKRSKEMMLALIARLRESEVLDADTKEQLAARIRQEFEQTTDERGNPRIGPYFPLQRFGRFYAFLRRFPTGEARTFRQVGGEPFSGEQAAYSALGKRRDLRGVNAVAQELADGTGWELREIGEPGFWMFESPGERRGALRELEAEGWHVVRQGLTEEAGAQMDAVSEGFMAEAITKLKAKGAQDEADMLYQMYLGTLNQMSIRKHFLHRKGTLGYSQDALRSFGWNMMRLAHQVAKLEHVPRLERALRAIEERKKSTTENLPARDATVADAFLQELKRRHQWVVNPDNSSWTNFVAGLGFFWYLGITPGAALVNLTQTPIVALPVLASRFGWQGSATQLGTAFVDVARGFNGRVVKGFLTGRPVPGEAAGLSAEERAAFAEWDLSGVRDRTRAHNLAGIGDTDAFWNGPTFNRVMAIISSAFHAAEIVNRDVTLLAGYRLAREQGKTHTEAVRVAEEATWEAHFDYANANRARYMQSNVAKTLLMFRSYAQHVSYFMWRNLYQAIRGQSKEVQREARTKFLGILGMTGLFAGALGMPLLSVVFATANAMAAAFGDDDEPWDAEVEFRNWLAQTFPDGVSDILERGPMNVATGLDWRSRVSLNQLWYREPDRDLDGAGTYQHIVEQLLGPVGGIAGSPFTGADLIAEGHWGRAAEVMTPKFLKDALRAGRFAGEGVLSKRGDPILEQGELGAYELVWQAMGMRPDALTLRQDATSAQKLYEGRILDRRSRLMTGYALAVIHEDAAAQARLLPQINAFNATQPLIPITARSIRTSVRNRQRYSEQAQGGVVINRRLAPEVQEAGAFGR
jgi:N12 class adenine-specific DNA methylase